MEHAEYTTGWLNHAMNLWLVPLNRLNHRIGLGADAGDVSIRVIREGMNLVVIGVGCELIASFVLVRTMRSLLFDMNVNDH
jgi:hypothetical protein